MNIPVAELPAKQGLSDQVITFCSNVEIGFLPSVEVVRRLEDMKPGGYYGSDPYQHPGSKKDLYN